MTAKAGDAHLQPSEVGHALEFLAKPTAPWHAGVATREADDVVLGKEGVEELIAASVVVPSVLLTRIEHERGRSAERGAVLTSSGHGRWPEVRLRAEYSARRVSSRRR